MNAQIGTMPSCATHTIVADKKRKPSMSAKPTFVAHVRASDSAIQPLEDHLRNVSAYAKRYASVVGLGAQGEVLGLLHDLGKYSREFQAYIQSATGILNQDEDDAYVDAACLRGRIDHSTAGAQLIWRELSKQGDLGRLVGQMLALCC